jgi:hypothetical protein
VAVAEVIEMADEFVIDNEGTGIDVELPGGADVPNFRKANAAAAMNTPQMRIIAQGLSLREPSR